MEECQDSYSDESTSKDIKKGKLEGANRGYSRAGVRFCKEQVKLVKAALDGIFGNESSVGSLQARALVQC